MSKERRHLMAVSVDGGIITLIDEMGVVRTYSQRGVRKLNRFQAAKAVQLGILNRSALELPELPYNVSIFYEEPGIMGGRPRATFDIAKLEKLSRV